MQRTIKFRGKRVDNGEWVFGYLKYNNEINHYYVKPETVGQFSGLHDKNGKEIYEGQNTNLGVVKFYCGSFILENEDESYLTLLQESNYDLYCLDVEILGE